MRLLASLVVVALLCHWANAGTTTYWITYDGRADRDATAAQCWDVYRVAFFQLSTSGTRDLVQWKSVHASSNAKSHLPADPGALIGDDNDAFWGGRPDQNGVLWLRFDFEDADPVWFQEIHLRQGASGTGNCLAPSVTISVQGTDASFTWAEHRLHPRNNIIPFGFMKQYRDLEDKIARETGRGQEDHGRRDREVPYVNASNAELDRTREVLEKQREQDLKQIGNLTAQVEANAVEEKMLTIVNEESETQLNAADNLLESCRCTTRQLYNNLDAALLRRKRLKNQRDVGLIAGALLAGKAVVDRPRAWHATKTTLGSNVVAEPVVVRRVSTVSVAAGAAALGAGLASIVNTRSPSPAPAPYNNGGRRRSSWAPASDIYVAPQYRIPVILMVLLISVILMIAIGVLCHWCWHQGELPGSGNAFTH